MSSSKKPQNLVFPIDVVATDNLHQNQNPIFPNLFVNPGVNVIQIFNKADMVGENVFLGKAGVLDGAQANKALNFGEDQNINGEEIQFVVGEAPEAPNES